MHNCPSQFKAKQRFRVFTFAFIHDLFFLPDAVVCPRRHRRRPTASPRRAGPHATAAWRTSPPRRTLQSSKPRSPSRTASGTRPRARARESRARTRWSRARAKFRLKSRSPVRVRKKSQRHAKPPKKPPRPRERVPKRNCLHGKIPKNLHPERRRGKIKTGTLKIRQATIKIPQQLSSLRRKVTGPRTRNRSGLALQRYER